MKTFKAAIIGLGNIGFKFDEKLDMRYILSYARAFSTHGGFDLVCGYDVDKNKLDSFNKKYDLPAYRFEDLKKGLKDIDVVVISVPAKYHCEVFKSVVSSCKPRMVIMEKPLALNLKEARKMVEIAKKNKTLLYVNYFRRVDPGIGKLKECIEQKRWGALKHVNIYYGQDLLNNGSHFVDLMTYLLGEPGSIKTLRREEKRDPDFVFFYKELSVFFKSSVGVDYNLKEMDFIFERARVSYSCLPETRLELPNRGSCFGTKELVDADSADLHLDLERFMLTVAGNVYNVLSGKSKPVSTGQTALHTLELCFDIMNKGVAK